MIVIKKPAAPKKDVREWKNLRTTASGQRLKLAFCRSLSFVLLSLTDAIGSRQKAGPPDVGLFRTHSAFFRGVGPCVSAHRRTSRLRRKTRMTVAAKSAVDEPGLRPHSENQRMPAIGFVLWEENLSLLGDPFLPTDVLFFAASEEIRTAVLAPHGRELVEELTSCAPCTLDEWATRSQHADREELVTLSRDLTEMGLVAFGSSEPNRAEGHGGIQDPRAWAQGVTL
ncbi:MAG: hypothetical protein SFV81_06670 [Pirellulaceae bacterium]|nr:hypothetical protein [Pirellulaceae bacterium]